MKRALHCLFYLLLVVFFLGCQKQEKTTLIPAHIISQKQMTDMLADIHLTDAKVKLLKKQKGNQIPQTYYDTLYQKNFTNHHSSRAQFDLSLAFYTTQPELLEAIYENVLLTLEEKNIEAGKRIATTDSLNIDSK